MPQQFPHVADLSHNNDPVDFHELQAGGVLGIIVKATQGTGFVDKMFHEYWKRVTSVPGLSLMAYHFLDGSDPQLQMTHFLNVTMGLPGHRVIDFEENASQISEPHAETCWNELLDQQGHEPMSYGSDLVLSALQNPDCVLGRGPLWIANYTHEPVLPHAFKYTLWQYSEHGKIPGSETGDIDLSVHISGDAAQAKAFLTMFAE